MEEAGVAVDEEATTAAPNKKEKHFSPEDCPKCEECPPCKAGAPAWMATFADMATLLMAFFVLLLSFAEMNVPKYKQINGSLKNAFGVQRIIPVVESPKAQSLIARHFSPSVAEPTPINTIRQETTDERKEEVLVKTDVAPEAQQAAEQLKQALAQEINRGEVEVKAEGSKVVVSMLTTPSVGGGDGPAGQRKGGAAADGSAKGGSAELAEKQGGASASGQQAAGASVKGAKQAGTVSQAEIEFYAKVADAQAKVNAAVEVRDVRNTSAVSTQGRSAGQGVGQIDSEAQYQRIVTALAKEIQSGKAEVERDGARIIVRLAEQGSFTSGSADLQPGFMQLLGQVAKSLGATQGRVFIEGHTDNVPVVFNERFRSNWDLSAARSAAVADYMSTNGGLNAARLSVAGYADTRPLGSNDDAAGRARNRRIEVIVDGG
jgi:chemotaxis protein MotB